MTDVRTVGVFKIPVHDPNPRSRLLKVEKDVQSLKRSPMLLLNFLTVPLFLGGPNWITNVLGRNWISSMVLSNLPGPNYACNGFYGRHFADDVLPWVPHMRGRVGKKFNIHFNKRHVTKVK